MKKLGLSFLALCALALSPTLVSSSAHAMFNAGDVISVSGTGQINVEPDMASVSMSVVTKAKTVSEAQATNAKIFNELVGAIKGQFQFERNDISSSGYSILSDYEMQNNVRVLVGYSVTHSIHVVLRDLSKLGDLLDVAGAHGANAIDSISLETSKQHQYELQALNLAMSDAAEKAQVIAKSAGRSVLRLVKVSQAGYQTENKSMRSDEARAYAASTQILTSQLTVSSSVVVDYAF